MKIVLVLLISFAFGQATNDVDTNGGGYHWGDGTEFDSITIPLIIPDAFVSKQDLFEYSEECYNDSTNTHVHGLKWNDSCVEQRGNLASGYWFKIVCKLPSHFEYLHRIPTFEGFIEWLRRKPHETP